MPPSKPLGRILHVDNFNISHMDFVWEKFVIQKTAVLRWKYWHKYILYLQCEVIKPQNCSFPSPFYVLIWKIRSKWKHSGFKTWVHFKRNHSLIYLSKLTALSFHKCCGKYRVLQIKLNSVVQSLYSVGIKMILESYISYLQQLKTGYQVTTNDYLLLGGVYI